MLDFKKTIVFNIRDVSIHISHYIHGNGERHPGDNPFDDGKHDRVSRLQGMAAGYIFTHKDQQVIQKDLEKGMSIGKSTASGLVKRMVKNGLIYTAPSSTDARVKCLYLTTYAIDIMHAINEHAIMTEKALRKGISEEDLATFFKVLNKIRENTK